MVRRRDLGRGFFLNYREYSPLKIRLATPQWKKLARVCKLCGNRVDETKQSIESINFVRQSTEKCLRCGAIRISGQFHEEDGHLKQRVLKGHGFSLADGQVKATSALAAEGCFCRLNSIPQA